MDSGEPQKMNKQEQAEENNIIFDEENRREVTSNDQMMVNVDSELVQTKESVEKGSKSPYAVLLMQFQQATNAKNKLTQNMAIKQDIYDLKRRMAFEQDLERIVDKRFHESKADLVSHTEAFLSHREEENTNVTQNQMGMRKTKKQFWKSG